MQIGRFTPSTYGQIASDVGAITPSALVLNATRPPVRDEADGTIVGDVPPAPTVEARAMVDKAAERVQELQAQNRELHFSRDEVTNRVVIEVRDLDGNVIRTIPPSKALDILSGADL
jgi:flagellar protein FlaG